ncbi:MAG: NAD-dependent epimerase/dehydratase family protein [Pseudomonadota bacterium]
MRTLVLGSGGMIGDAVAASLVESGHDVVCASRSAEPDLSNGVIYRRANRNDPDQILQLVNTLGIKVVIDIIAYDADSTESLLHSLEGKIDQYVLLSSCDVYRNYGLLHRLELGTPDLNPLMEDSPLRSRLFPYRLAKARTSDDPQKWLDDYDKIPVESSVRKFEGNWTVLRLPMVFGPGDPQQRFHWAIAPMLSGSETIEVPSAWLNWTTTYGYIQNVASAISASAGNAPFKNSTFNIVDIEPKSHREWLNKIASEIGWRGQVLETESQDHPIAVATASLDLNVPLIVSGRALSDRTGYEPKRTQHRALIETISACRERATQT